jgi:hypothetical protein
MHWEAAVSRAAFAECQRNFSALKWSAAVAPTGRRSTAKALEQAMKNGAYFFIQQTGTKPEFNSGWMQQPAAQMAASLFVG